MSQATARLLLPKLSSDEAKLKARPCKPCIYAVVLSRMAPAVQGLCREMGQRLKSQVGISAKRHARCLSGLFPSRRRELSEEGERMPVWEAGAQSLRRITALLGIASGGRRADSQRIPRNPCRHAGGGLSELGGRGAGPG